jgi:low affinity Fe/Cu permease
MPIGILFWVLMILWAIGSFIGWGGTWGIYANTGLLLVLFGLLGWKNFGPPLQ